MPGVPSGKGCDACRKQKKKCDLGKPSCSRCTRLRISCIGAGQQRYKFKDQSRTVKRLNSDSSSEVRSETTTPDPSTTGEEGVLSRSPSSELSMLAAALVQAVKPETSWRFNIAHAYGGFLSLVPQRLGRNAALDASVAALTEAHSDFCNAQPASRSVLSKYSQALTKLRMCLDDPRVATQAETLCSVMLLLITQSFIGTGGSRSASSHVVGMAKLLKVRGTHHDPNDPFESMLLLTLRGPVVFESLWNDQIQFTEAQWRELVENRWDSDSRPEGILMRGMAKLPNYILRGRKVLKGDAIDTILVQEVSILYDQFREAEKNIVKRIENVKQRMQVAGPDVSVLMQIYDSVLRIHSFLLAVVVIVGCVLGVVDKFTPELQQQLNDCAAEIYAYVPWCQQWRPLGSSYMLLSLSMAWAGTNDPNLRAKIQEAYIEHHRDFPLDQYSGSVVGSLEEGTRRFLSLGVDRPSRRSSEDELERAKQMWPNPHTT